MLHAHTHTLANTKTHTHTHTYTPAHTHPHTRTNPHTHTHTHRPTHAGTHILRPPGVEPGSQASRQRVRDCHRVSWRWDRRTDLQRHPGEQLFGEPNGASVGARSQQAIPPVQDVPWSCPNMMCSHRAICTDTDIAEHSTCGLVAMTSA